MKTTKDMCDSLKRAAECLRSADGGCAAVRHSLAIDLGEIAHSLDTDADADSVDTAADLASILTRLEAVESLAEQRAQSFVGKAWQVSVLDRITALEQRTVSGAIH